MNTTAAGTLARHNLLSILQVRNFALLWSGQAISQLGDTLFYLAEIWLVLQLTGSALAMGMTAILTMLPRLLLLLVGGVSVDRYDRRKLMLASDLLRALFVFIFALLVGTQQIQMAGVYVLAICFGIVGAFFDPANDALVPNLVPREGLVAANSLLFLTQKTTQIVGPALAGLLIAVPAIGVAGVSFINAASFLAGALGLALLRVPPSANPAPRRAAPLRSELTAGFRYLFGLRALVIIFVLGMVINFAVSPVSVVVPLYAKVALGQGAEGIGLLLSALGLGMVLGSAAIGLWSPHSSRGLLIFTETILGGLLFIAMGLWPVFEITFALLLMFGIVGAMVNTTLMALTQAMVVDEYRGRVFSAHRLIATGLMPVGLALGGALADALAPGLVLSAGGVLTVLVAAAGLLFHEIRELQ